MGFLDFWQERPKEVQGALFGEGKPQIDRTEPNRKLANRKLGDEIKKRGGQPKTYAAVNRSASEIVLGETPRELYEKLCVKHGDRSQLPEEAKEALMTGDIAARHQIVEDDARGHAPIVDAAKRGYHQARKLFPW